MEQNKMPVLFLSHGSPMNALANNNYTKVLKSLGEKYQPKAILIISAHWITDGKVLLQNSKIQKTIHDFRGFPKELFDVQYNPQGNDFVTNEVIKNISEVLETDNWGVDHGSWSILVHMYPEANIPVVQLSIDWNKNMKEHFDLGKKLHFLTDLGIMVVGSGNVSHNLRFVDFYNKTDLPSTSWAKELNEEVNNAILLNEIDKLLDFKSFSGANFGIANPDHYIPLIYCLGAGQNKKAQIIYDKFELGTLTMSCFEWI